MTVQISDGNVNVVIGPEQQAAFQRTLKELTGKEGVACVLLIDTAGKIIAGAGSLGRLEAATVAALAAGDFATTRALAHRVGEKDFSLVFQRDRELNVYLQAVTEEAILVLLFEQGQGLGPVRMLVRQAQGELKRTLDECTRAVVGPDALQETVGITPGEAGGGVSPSGEAPSAAPEEAELDATGEAETPAPAEKPAKPSKLVRNPPADIIRKFWRIKTLAEDCVKNGVPASASDAWREARDRIAAVARSLSSGEAAETRKLLAEVEKLLMDAYRTVIAERTEEDEDLKALGVWHRLVDLTEAPFAFGLKDLAPAILANADRDSVDRHPDILGLASNGHLPLEGLRTLKTWPKDRRRKAIARAMLDLLLNRLWVTDKIFGRGVGDAVVGKWKAAADAGKAAPVPPEVESGLAYLFAQAAKRGAGRRGVPPSGGTGAAPSGAGES